MTKEEAIEIVRENMHLSLDEGHIFEALKTLVPELDESEDERIRKEIIHFFKDASKGKTRVTTSETLAKWAEFLEKQKEQNPTECIEFDNEFKNQVSHLLASVLNKEWEYNKGFVEYAAQQLLGYAKHEIKPVKWSKEDERNLYNTIEAIKYAYDVSEGSGGSRLIAWLKFHLRPQSHWKPSEEQLLQLQFALNLLEEKCGSVPNVLWNLYDALKKL